MTQIKLRPHHALGYIWHEIAEENGEGLFALPDEKYIALFRQKKGSFHSDELILHWRNTLKQLHENPDLEFEYVKDINDSICEKCEHKDNCGSPSHEYHKIVLREDSNAVQLLPELKFGKTYNVHYLRSFIPTIRARRNF